MAKKRKPINAEVVIHAQEQAVIVRSNGGTITALIPSLARNLAEVMPRFAVLAKEMKDKPRGSFASVQCDPTYLRES